MISTIILFMTYSHRPPIGGMYVTKLNFPIIGYQNIHLLIKSKQFAEINLNGIISHKESIEYKINKEGTIDFTFTPKLQRILNKFLISIYDAQYITDYAQINILIKPIHFKKRIILHRSIT